MKKKLIKLYEQVITNWPIKILSLAAAIVLAQIYRNSLLETRYISVPLVLENATDFVPVSDYPNNVQVELRGDINELPLIQKTQITAFIDLGRYKKAAQYTMPVQIRFHGTAQSTTPLETHVEPADVIVRLEKSLTKNIPIIPALNGTVADGYESDQVIMDPASVQIRGPQSHVEPVNNLSTEDISLHGQQTTLSGIATIKKTSKFISILGSNKVRYTVSIKEKQITKTYNNIPVTLFNLPSTVTLLSELPQISLQVEGSENFLKIWQPSGKIFTISGEKITKPGIYNLNVEATLDEPLKILNFSPKSIQVDIQQKITTDNIDPEFSTDFFPTNNLEKPRP